MLTGVGDGNDDNDDDNDNVILTLLKTPMFWKQLIWDTNVCSDHKVTLLALSRAV